MGQISQHSENLCLHSKWVEFPSRLNLIQLEVPSLFSYTNMDSCPGSIDHFHFHFPSANKHGFLANTISKLATVCQTYLHYIPSAQLSLKNKRRMQCIVGKSSHLRHGTPPILLNRLHLLPNSKTLFTRCFRRLRPYHRESTGSRLITEVKPGRAKKVLRRVTAQEHFVLQTFFPTFLPK